MNRRQMRISVWGLAAMGVAWMLASPAVAQQGVPRAGYVYPGGARQGTTVRLVVGGQFLDGVSDVLVSGGGLKAKVIEHLKPLSPRDRGILQDKLAELQKKRGEAQINRAGARPATRPSTRPIWTPEDDKLFNEIRAKLMTLGKRVANPAIGETVAIEITVDANAAPGMRELRLVAGQGLTAPLFFQVGQLPESNEIEPSSSVAPVETAITLPTVANGQIMPGDVDRWRFKAKRGQHLMVIASARELIPYLPDGVPGWFQATLAILDAKGKELAYDDDYHFNPDPVIHFEVPADGEYLVEIKDAIYRGREDFVYRISIGELPFVTGVFPPGGRAGEQVNVQVTGWNLTTTRLTPNFKEPGLYTLTTRKGDLISNRVPFAVDTLWERQEQEPNNQQSTPQGVTMPTIINGRIDQPGDVDVFRIDGKSGDKLVAEVMARRVNSPVDSVLRLTDAAGKQLAANDDHEDKGAGLTTHHADSYLSFTLPASGAYYLTLADAQKKGGPDYAYRLRISPPRPDFELRLAPSSVTLRGGTAIPLTVHALRKDGYSGEIVLEVKDGPKGMTLSGGRIPADENKVRLTVTAAQANDSKPFSFSLVGRGKVGEQTITREALPAEDMMQAFIYRHLVPMQETMMASAGRGPNRGGVKIMDSLPVKIPAGGTASVKVSMPMKMPGMQFHLELSEPPDGITVASVTPAGFGTELVLACDPAKVKVGLEGNLIVSAFGSRADPKNAEANKRRMPLGSLPAIPFQIVKGPATQPVANAPVTQSP